MKYVKYSKKCRQHTNFREGIIKNCHYCRRASAHNSNIKISPEESLLRDIFNNTDSRFYKITTKSKKYKGHRPL